MSSSATFPLPPLVIPPAPDLGAYSAETLERMREMALALLPPGWAFTRRLAGNISTVLEALCVEFARWHSEVSVLRSQVSPRRASRLDYLEAWEEAAGIVPTGTIAERTAAAAAKIRGRRSHALSAYQAAAEALGFTFVALEPSDEAPFEASTSRIGDSVADSSWAFVFTLHVSGGDPGQLPALEEALRGIKRGHTIVRVHHDT